MKFKLKDLKDDMTLEDMANMLFWCQTELLAIRDLLLKHKEDPKPCLTISEAAIFTGYSESSIRGMMRNEEITYYKNKGKVFIDRDELIRVMRTGKVPSDFERRDAIAKYNRTGDHRVLHRALYHIPQKVK